MRNCNKSSINFNEFEKKIENYTLLRIFPSGARVFLGPTCNGALNTNDVVSRRVGGGRAAE